MEEVPAEPPAADLEPAPQDQPTVEGWGAAASQPPTWDSTPPAEPDAAMPIDLEPEPPATEPMVARPASLAELAQETVTAPPPPDSEMPSVDIDDEGAAEDRPRLAPMHEFIPASEAVGAPPAKAAHRPEPEEEPAPATRRMVVDPAKLEAQAREAVQEKAGEAVERVVREIVERVAREVLSKAARELLEKVAWEVVPSLAETILREEIEKLVQEKLREG